MGSPDTGWRCADDKPCAEKGQLEQTNLVVGVIDEDTSPERSIDPRTVDATVTPLWRNAPPPPLLKAKLSDPKGGVDLRYENVTVGWYRVRVFRRANPGGPIVKEETRDVQVVKIRRPVKPSDEHHAVTMTVRRPTPKEKPRLLTFFQVGFLDKNAPGDPIPGLRLKLALREAPTPVEVRSDADGQVLLVEPDVSPGTVDILSICDDRDQETPIVYDEFAQSRLPTNVLQRIEIPDKRKVADRIASARNITRRSEWHARRPKAPLEQDWDYDTVVLHHSGPIPHTDPRAVQDEHMDSRADPFDDVGYHYMVHPDGTVYEGRFLAYKGSHVERKNTHKIGILVMGSFIPSGEVLGDSFLEPSDAQIRSTKLLIKVLKLHFPLRTLGGHLDFKPTTLCPGKLLYEQLDGIRDFTGLAAP